MVKQLAFWLAEVRFLITVWLANSGDRFGTERRTTSQVRFLLFTFVFVYERLLSSRIQMLASVSMSFREWTRNNMICQTWQVLLKLDDDFNDGHPYVDYLIKTIEFCVTIRLCLVAAVRFRKGIDHPYYVWNALEHPTKIGSTPCIRSIT